MPRNPEENERIRQLAMNNIRTTAMEVFLERGYHAASTDEIARRAGVAKGLIYNYFQTKEGLLAEIVTMLTEEIAAVMDSVRHAASPQDQLKQVVDGALNYVTKHPKAYRFLLHLQTMPEEDVILYKYGRQLNEEMAKQFRVQNGIFMRMEAGNPEARSLYFSSVLHGVMLLISLYPGYPVEQVKEQIFSEFCS